MQKGHLGNRINKAVDKNEIKPLLLRGSLSKTIIGFVLQQGSFGDSMTATDQ